MISPYITSGPVSGADFYGREELIAEITGGRQRAFYVLGTRQIGMTSLLHQIDTLVPALRLDAQWAAGRLSHLVGQAQWDLEGKRERFPWLPAPEAGPDDDLFALLRKVDRAAAEADRTLWLLVDEAEGLLSIARNHPSVLYWLRGTVQYCLRLCTVLAAVKTLSEANRIAAALGSPFLRGFARRYLGGLSSETAMALLCQSQSDTPVEVDEALAMQLINLTNGHPLLLQLLGERLFTAGRLRPCDDEDLDIIEAAKSDIFSQDLACRSNVELQMLYALVEGKLVPADVDSTCLHDLTQLGYLRERGGQLSLGDSFLERWLQNNRARLKLREAGTVSERTELEAIRQERIASLQQQLATHHKDLNRLQEQAAFYGAREVPLRLLNQIEAEEREIQRVETELRQLNRYKRERSNDMFTDPTPQQWAMNVLTAATTWLFTQASEVLKERQEKR